MNTRWFVGAAIVVLCSGEVPALWGQEAVDQLERNLDMPLEGRWRRPLRRRVRAIWECPWT